MHTGLQAQDISPTILFVPVWDGRDGENLPTGYKPDFLSGGVGGGVGRSEEGGKARVIILR